MIFGMLPVALGAGEGAETRSPMGIAVIGGLLTSLFLTLIVVPVAYDVADALLTKIRRKKEPAESGVQEKGKDSGFNPIAGR